MTGQTCQPSAESDSRLILKHDAEKVFRESGLTATQAITLFYKQVELERGLPFAVRVPNDATVEALEQARTLQELESFNTLDDLFEDVSN